MERRLKQNKKKKKNSTLDSSSSYNDLREPRFVLVAMIATIPKSGEEVNRDVDRKDKKRERTEKEGGERKNDRYSSHTVFARIYAHIARAPIVVKCKIRYKDSLALKRRLLRIKKVKERREINIPTYIHIHIHIHLQCDILVSCPIRQTFILTSIVGVCPSFRVSP